MANSYTISLVNIGTNPNDGTGEPLRTAFSKVNKNFSNVYSFAIDIANTAAYALTLASNVSGGGGGGGSGNANLVGYATLAYVANTVSNLVSLTRLNNALANLNYVNLGQLNNAIANISTVNLGALNNALANVNVTTLSNFTNVFNTIAANAANVAKVSIVSNLSANGTANGQAVYNSADGGLYIWRGNAWISPGAAFTPTANSISGVEIFTSFSLPTGPGDGRDFNGRQGFYNSNLYIKVGGAWTSYNSFITGSGTPVLSAGIITATELAAGSVIAGKIAAAAITSAEIAAGNITSSLLAANSIIAGKIAAGVVSATEIAANAIIATKIAANAITAEKIEANAITANKIAANAITAVQIAANAVYANAIMSNAITTDKIAANAITAVVVAANAIYGNSIMAGTITGDRIKANSVSGIVITANTLFANAIQAFSITSDRIAANAVTADKIDGRGLVIRDASGNPLFNVGGVLAASVTVQGSTKTLGTLAGLTPLQFTGSGTSFPSSPSINDVWLLTTTTPLTSQSNTYVYTSTGWSLFVPGGITGATGSPGSPGAPGTPGATGAQGRRGPAQIANAIVGTSWNDSLATAAIAGWGFGTANVLDQVTLYNTASGFSQTKFYNGTAWTAIDAYLNGNLLVNGTVGAAQIAAGSIDATKIAASSITADKLSVTNLSALSANIGYINAGSIGGAANFAGELSAAGGTFVGNLTAASGTFTGNLTAAGGTFSGSLSGATGEFAGTLRAGVLDLGALNGISTTYTYSAAPYTITAPTGKTSMRVTLQAGGGGGGGGSARAWGPGGFAPYRTAGGGGAGGLTIALFTNVAAGTQFKLYTGVGGVGGTTTDTPYTGYPGTGASGTSTYFTLASTGAVWATTTGGAGGLGVGTGTGGAAGTGSLPTGYISLSQAGQPGGIYTDYQWAAVRGGQGGSSKFGAGGIGGIATSALSSTGTRGGDGVLGAGGGGASAYYAWDGPGYYPGKGGDGTAVVEFFDPNSVVLKSTFDAVVTALRNGNYNLTGVTTT